MNMKQKQDFKSGEVLKYLLLWTRLILESYKGVHTKLKRSQLPGKVTISCWIKVFGWMLLWKSCIALCKFTPYCWHSHLWLCVLSALSWCWNYFSSSTTHSSGNVICSTCTVDIPVASLRFLCHKQLIRAYISWFNCAFLFFLSSST